ncbi:integrin alpha-L-like isoform X1 [Centropristis striata]|uniref:integrin alpha-L-like isoform X1 n=1 Tax=Centropristis striata TaxID=184440 RepID=UPI0027DF6791|nr:integrin alpha-L-like isoform X1 [Centropristis striata]
MGVFSLPVGMSSWRFLGPGGLGGSAPYVESVLVYPGSWWSTRVLVVSPGPGGLPGSWWSPLVLVVYPGSWWSTRVLVVSVMASSMAVGSATSQCGCSLRLLFPHLDPRSLAMSLHCQSICAVSISVSSAFNIDTTNPHIYTAEQNDLFANKVLQIISGKKGGILGSAPQQPNGCEETSKSDLNSTHQCFIIPETLLTNETPVKHFGLSVSEDSRCSQITVFSPSVVHECYGNSNLNSTRYNSRPAYQECTKKTVDLVFLFDGSGSMEEEEFNKIKNLIVEMMNSLKNLSIKFAAVQFSTQPRKVFDFNDYEEGRALRNLMQEPHMSALSNTYRALAFVLNDIFENSAAGASPDATKIMILITDGVPTDTDRDRIINRYDEKNIIRFIIAVKDASLDGFRAFASEPKDKNTFKMENYEGLPGILEDIQKKIFKMEVAQAQMCQSEVAAVFYKVCRPSETHECKENSVVNSVCYKRKDDLQPISSFTPAFQESTSKKIDLVFLFDGSGSMTEAEFNKNKDFIVEIMSSLKNLSIKFAAVQFSTAPRKVFDFNDYEAGRDLEQLKKEPQMKYLTNTHKALTFVLENILENPAAGASPDATKVVVVITDGDPSDRDRNGIIAKYDEKNIIRFVIGVRDAGLDRIRTIASEPKDKNTFKIENYEGLPGILEDIQKKIFKMEVAHEQMGQTGFSAVFYNDTLILGSVGSNSWRGWLQNHHEQKETHSEDPLMQMNSYIGSSISTGVKNSFSLYFMGAPRFEHTGQVVLLRHNWKKWTAAQRLNGDQIGSYFGAELCSVDVDSDGNTDFLLVGAPRFSQEEKEGQIYVYALTDEMQLKSQLNVTAPSMGRFGTTISSLADLNGDGLRDVAVGAPLEDDNRGSVYIYLGDRHKGMRSTFSQKIRGLDIKPELRFFGHAIDGDFDLGEDGIPDIVVGSQGMAVVLRGNELQTNNLIHTGCGSNETNKSGFLHSNRQNSQNSYQHRRAEG